MSRRYRIWLAAVLLVSLAQLRANGQVMYSITDLNTLGGSASFATGINDQGEVVGQSTTASGQSDAFLWNNGAMTNLGVIGSDTQSEAFGINNLGQVVGVSGPGTSTDGQAFLWQNGTMQNLGIFDNGTSDQANAINDSGKIAGLNFTAKANNYEGFSLQGGSFTALQGIIPWTTSGVAINSTGDIAGFSNSTDSTRLPVVWLSGSTSPTQLSTTSGYQGIADGINASDEIVGQQYNGIRSDPVEWQNGSEATLGSLGGQNGAANAINTSGTVVGFSFTTANVQHGFVDTSGQMTDLNSVVPANSGWTITDATSINGNGDIAANATNSSGQTHAVLLTPYNPQQVHILSYGVNWPSLDPSDPTGLLGGKAASLVSQAFGAHLAGVADNTVDDLNWASSTNISSLQNSVTALGNVVQPGDLAIIYIGTHGTYDPNDPNTETPIQRQVNGSQFVTTSVATSLALQGKQANGSPDTLDAVDFAKLFSGSNWQGVNKLFIIDSCYAGGLWSGPSGSPSYLSGLDHSAIIAAAPESFESYYSSGTLTNPGESFLSVALEDVLSELGEQQQLDFSSFCTDVQAQLSSIEYASGNGFPEDAQVLWGGGPVPISNQFFSSATSDFSFDPITEVPEPAVAFVTAPVLAILLRRPRRRLTIG